MDAECTRLVNALGVGADKRFKRKNLAVYLRISDRQLRKLIEQCQNEGVPIISLKKGGYYLAESLDELRQYIRRERHRELAIEKKLYALNWTEWFD